MACSFQLVSVALYLYVFQPRRTHNLKTLLLLAVIMAFGKG